MRDIIENPAVATSTAFAARVDQIPSFLPLEQDLQAMSFYGWLRARMQRRPYYDVLLEIAGAPMAA